MATKEEIEMIQDWIRFYWSEKCLQRCDINKDTEILEFSMGLLCKSIHPRINRLKKLKELSIEMSSIKTFLFNHSTIKKINLISNDISKIKINCPQLEYLDIRNNKLKIIEDINAPNLKEFHCDDNLLFKDKKLYQLAKKFGYNPKLIQDSNFQDELF